MKNITYITHYNTILEIIGYVFSFNIIFVLL